MARPYYGKASFKWGKYLKYFLIFIVIFIPLLIVVLVFSPLAKQKAVKEINTQYDRYVLPAQFTKENFEQLIEKMKEDNEFKFYFYAFSNDQIDLITNETYMILDQNREREGLLKTIQEQKKMVQGLSEVFFSLEYPDDFIKNPKNYPELNNVIWSFLQEEFKLTLLGAIYKSNFNREFLFLWGDSVHLSADKLRKIIFSLKREVKVLPNNS